MSALGVIQASLLTVSVVLFVILQPIFYVQIHLHLVRHHRKACDRVGISTDAWYMWKHLWKDDCEPDNSLVVFDRFFYSGKYQALKDKRLDALWHRVRLIRRMSGVGFALLLLTFLVFRADPAHIWDFLRELARS
jgi:hypothetical protein